VDPSLIAPIEENCVKTLKVFARALGVLALLLLAPGLSVSPSAALGTGPAGQAVGPLTNSSIPQMNGPQGGGPVPGRPGFVILNGFDFKPYLQTANYQYTGSMLQNPGTSLAYYLAPVHLPQGATVNQVIAYYFDYDGVVDLEVELLQCDNLSGAIGIMASLSSSGASPSMTFTVTSAISTPLVYNASYSYAVQVSLPNSSLIGLEAVRIDYTYPVTLPLVLK
jgi:hypothetical protein